MNFRALVLGSNPSRAQADPSVPFVGTKSHAVLLGWLKWLGCTHARVENVSKIVTPGNRPLRVSEYDYDHVLRLIAEEQPDVVLALGRTASKVLSRVEVRHFELPHPSGLNRKLNDTMYLKNKLDECKIWIARRLVERMEDAWVRL